MNWNAEQHSYEELRALVLDEVLAQTCRQFEELQQKVGQSILSREGRWPPSETGIAYPGIAAYLHPYDSDTLLEIFWDLFRQGVITLGLNSANPGWPWFRLSRFGQTIKQQGQTRFHDTASYVSMIKAYDPELSDEALLYLEEAAASFYAECLLSASVMLGVAAEAEFLRLIGIAEKSASHGVIFAAVGKEKFIRQKIRKFQAAISTIVKSLPSECTEELDTNLSMIQAVLRVARNDAGHPSGSPAPPREQVYVNMQLFGPFARQLASLRKALA
jgi:hypothetical protein